MTVPDDTQNLEVPYPEAVFTAHHEAGHAVAMIASDVSFRYLSIRARTPGLIGNTRAYRYRLLPAALEGPILTAGLAAELFLLHLTRCNTGMSAKIQTALWLGEIHNSGDDTEINRAVDRCPDALVAGLNLVVGHWAAITALADAALSSPRAVTHREARAVVAPHMPR